jgi:hypothetical protein
VETSTVRHIRFCRMWVARCWVLKGQPRCGVFLRIRVQARSYTASIVRGPRVRVWCGGGSGVAVMGSGVRWGVCELDSGCEHLVVLDCCSVVISSVSVMIEFTLMIHSCVSV